MSEEIIIDDVNVAGCCCYENDKCLWTKRYYENNIVPDCEKVKNCYYKRLKRLQAENERLKDDKNRYELYIKQERDNNFTYKQALEEIRGINKNFFDMNYGFDEQGISEDVKEVAREIQDKISEVLDD